ncbi:hypothetical protein VDGL01_03240 [Verticillium dahliae]
MTQGLGPGSGVRRMHQIKCQLVGSVDLGICAEPHDHTRPARLSVVALSHSRPSDTALPRTRMAPPPNDGLPKSF